MERPKRRKYRDNPYTLKLVDNHYYILFRDGQKIPRVESLPYSKRKNYRFGYTFDSPYKYTYSIFVSTFEGEGSSNIIATINTKEKVCFYTIDKLNNIKPIIG